METIKDKTIEVLNSVHLGRASSFDFELFKQKFRLVHGHSFPETRIFLASLERVYEAPMKGEFFYHHPEDGRTLEQIYKVFEIGAEHRRQAFVIKCNEVANKLEHFTKTEFLDGLKKEKIEAYVDKLFNGSVEKVLESMPQLTKGHNSMYSVSPNGAASELVSKYTPRSRSTPMSLKSAEAKKAYDYAAGIGIRNTATTSGGTESFRAPLKRFPGNNYNAVRNEKTKEHTQKKDSGSSSSRGWTSSKRRGEKRATSPERSEKRTRNEERAEGEGKENENGTTKSGDTPAARAFEDQVELRQPPKIVIIVNSQNVIQKEAEEVPKKVSGTATTGEQLEEIQWLEEASEKEGGANVSGKSTEGSTKTAGEKIALDEGTETVGGQPKATGRPEHEKEIGASKNVQNAVEQTTSEKVAEKTMTGEGKEAVSGEAKATGQLKTPTGLEKESDSNGNTKNRETTVSGMEKAVGGESNAAEQSADVQKGADAIAPKRAPDVSGNVNTDPPMANEERAAEKASTAAEGGDVGQPKATEQSGMPVEASGAAEIDGEETSDEETAIPLATGQQPTEGSAQNVQVIPTIPQEKEQPIPVPMEMPAIPPVKKYNMFRSVPRKRAPRRPKPPIEEKAPAPLLQPKIEPTEEQEAVTDENENNPTEETASGDGAAEEAVAPEGQLEVSGEQDVADLVAEVAVNNMGADQNMPEHVGIEAIPRHMRNIPFKREPCEVITLDDDEEEEEAPRAQKMRKENEAHGPRQAVAATAPAIGPTPNNQNIQDVGIALGVVMRAFGLQTTNVAAAPSSNNTEPSPKNQNFGKYIALALDEKERNGKNVGDIIAKINQAIADFWAQNS